jgi:hypothetical protein
MQWWEGVLTGLCCWVTPSLLLVAIVIYTVALDDIEDRIDEKHSRR